MSGWVLVLDVCVCVVLAFLLLRRYGDLAKQQRMVLLATLLAWCLCFIIVFTIPLDVSTVSVCSSSEVLPHAALTHLKPPPQDCLFQLKLCSNY